jgi:hypothetical protein
MGLVFMFHVLWNIRMLTFISNCPTIGRNLATRKVVLEMWGVEEEEEEKKKEIDEVCSFR